MKKIRSNFISLSIMLLIAAVSAPFNHAQTTTVVRVLTSPVGPQFTVDGTVYSTPFSSFWPIGSQHTLSIPAGVGYSYSLDGSTQWVFSNWQWPGGTTNSTNVTLLATTSSPQYTAVFSTQYKLTLNVVCSPDPCGTTVPGVAIINNGGPGLVSADTLATWWAPGSSLLLQSSTSSGWLFAGWQVGNNPLVVNALDEVVVSGPMTVSAVFVPAKSVNFATIPSGLQMNVDRAPITAPRSFPWGLGTSHTLGGLDLQEDINGKYWVFKSWSDGGAQNHTYVVGKTYVPETITATYAAAAYPFFLTSPSNLNLVVDGQTLPPPYSYIWGVGSTHQVSAPVTQADGKGNTYTFKSWDDGVTTASRSVTIPANADVNSYRLTALYTASTTKSTLNITSTVSGLSVSVDGTPCMTPCSVTRDPGTQVHVSAPASVPVGGGSRQDFLGWSTGGAAPIGGDWVATLSGSSVNISAAYHLMNLLTTTATPSGGVRWAISPASPDGFYDSQMSVNLAVTAQPGFRFSNWSGDLSGSAPAASLNMGAPHAVVAQLARVPYIAPSGVTNAAGDVPQAGVAAGSVATIFGASLSENTAIGPSTPLTQALAGVTAHIGTRMLPLYFASPTQINLQIPPDLEPGSQTITVSSQGMPDVNSNFNIVRNAPGLFPMVLDGQSYALVLHEDGSLVTPTSPAQKSELLTAYITGLGPTSPARPEGVAVPVTPRYAALDPVSVQVGTAIFTPDGAFAAPGQVGLDLIQFRLDSSAPSGVAIPVYFTINGVTSNTLNLPIQ